MYLLKPMWLKDEDNYEDWKYNMTLFLGSKGLYRFVDMPKPSSESGEADIDRT